MVARRPRLCPRRRPAAAPRARHQRRLPLRRPARGAHRPDARALPRAGRVRRGRVAGAFRAPRPQARRRPLLRRARRERRARALRRARARARVLRGALPEAQRVQLWPRLWRRPAARRGERAPLRAARTRRVGVHGARARVRPREGAHGLARGDVCALRALGGRGDRPASSRCSRRRAGRGRRRGRVAAARVGRCVRNAGWYSMPTLPPARVPCGLGGLPRELLLPPSHRRRRRRALPPPPLWTPWTPRRRALPSPSPPPRTPSRAPSRSGSCARRCWCCRRPRHDPTKPRPRPSTLRPVMAQGRTGSRAAAFLAEGRRAAARWASRGTSVPASAAAARYTRSRCGCLRPPAQARWTRGLVEPGGAGQSSRSQPGGVLCGFTREKFAGHWVSPGLPLVLGAAKRICPIRERPASRRVQHGPRDASTCRDARGQDHSPLHGSRDGDRGWESPLGGRARRAGVRRR